MKEKMQKMLLTFVLILLMMRLIVLPVSAANRSAAIPRFVVGAGGLGATSGSISLQTTLGQPVTGQAAVTSISLQSGFWTSLGAALSRFFLPMLIR